MEIPHKTARFFVTALSAAALVWLCLLYSFACLCWYKLGHFPIPSVDDPKFIGFYPLYVLVILGGLVAFSSMVFWLIALPFTLRNKLLNGWNTTLFLTGAFLLLAQLIYDPLHILDWLID